LDGFGVEKDKEEGMKWLRLAASSGSEGSRNMLSDLEKGGCGNGR